MSFNLLPVAKKSQSQDKTKRTKLRSRKLKIPSGQALVPKCFFSRGPIAYGIVPRPKKPGGYDMNLKSSKDFPSKSMDTWDSSNRSITERMDSRRSLGSYESMESVCLRALFEADEDSPLARMAKPKKPKKPKKPNESKTMRNQTIASFAGRGGVKQVEDEMAITSHSFASQSGRRKKRLSGVIDADDELEITNHLSASRREKRPSADVAEQPTATSPPKFGRGMRNKQLISARTRVRTECRSWVLWTEECDKQS